MREAGLKFYSSCVQEAAIGLPVIAITAYLLWVWPKPAGNSVVAEAGPYLVSLLAGAPFIWTLARRSRRAVVLVAFFVGGFMLLWLYALAVLCGVRGVCL